jgi:NAD(P)-dependent dehydrogenase (short-subunit alcohol dehydrogenase family)
VASSLDGKVVAVAGASSGTGKVTAQRFAAEGAHVVMLARRKERLDEAAREVGSGAVPIATNIAEPEHVRAAFDQIDAQFGRLDALLNLAGTARARLIEEASDDDISAVVGTNFLGPIYTTRAAIPLMKKAGGGDIVNVSSEVTLDDMPMMTLYSSTKRALEAFTRTMTKELRKEHIRVTLVVMGATAPTSFLEDFSPEDLQRAFPLWEADGFLNRVSGAHAPMDASWVADALLYAVTRPRGMMMDVIHTRVSW